MTMFGGSRYNVDAARGGAYQPINYVISQTADSSGSATFLFDAVALSNTWTLTINCAGAPDTARWTATTGGTNFGQFKGSNSWGPLQLQGGDRLQVNATGLIPGQLYQLAGYGYCNVVNEPEIIYPTAYADTVTSSTEQIYIGKGSTTITGSGGQIFQIPINATYRSLYLVFETVTGPAASTLTITGIGNSTGFQYTAILVPYSATGNQAIYRIPIVAMTDTYIFVSAGTTSTSGTYNYWYGADLADVDAAVYPEGSFEVTVDPTSNVNVTVTNSELPVQFATQTLAYQQVTANSVTFTINENWSTLQSIYAFATTSVQITVVGTYTSTNYSSLAVNINPTAAVFGYSIPAYVINPLDTGLTITLSYPAAPSTWYYWYGISNVPALVEVVNNTLTPFYVRNQTSTPIYIEGVQGTSANAVLITGQGAVPSSTPVPITNAYASSGLSVLANGQSGATYQNEVTYGGATSTSVTTTSTAATQILAAPTTGKSYRIHAVNMYWSGTLSTTPVVGRFLSGGTGPAYATLCFPYFSTVYLGGLLTNTAIDVICSSTTSTTFSIEYDIVSTPTIA